jgi:hypothetical protein
LVAPVSLHLPWQCGACAAGAAPIVLQPDPAINWADLGTWFNWLGVQLWNRVAYPIICWSLNIAQAVLTAMQIAINTVVVAGINGVWRLLLLALLSAWSSLDSLWVGMEWFRSLFWSMQGWIAGLSASFSNLIAVLGALLGLAAEIIGRLAGVMLAAGGAIGYFLGLFYALVPGIVVAVANPIIPPEIVGIESNWLIIAFIDTIRGIVDSKLGWAWGAFVAIMYARFAMWVVDELALSNS